VVGYGHWFRDADGKGDLSTRSAGRPKRKSRIGGYVEGGDGVGGGDPALGEGD